MCDLIVASLRFYVQVSSLSCVECTHLSNSLFQKRKNIQKINEWEQKKDGCQDKYEKTLQEVTDYNARYMEDMSEVRHVMSCLTPPAAAAAAHYFLKHSNSARKNTYIHKNDCTRSDTGCSVVALHGANCGKKCSRSSSCINHTVVLCAITGIQQVSRVRGEKTRFL